MRRAMLAAGLAACLAGVLAIPTASVGGPAGGEIRVDQAWIRPTPSHAPTAAGYAVITNRDRWPDTFLGASSPAADRVELHHMMMDRGIMSMKPVPGGVTLSPGGSIDLQRAGYHLMFIHPHRPFRPGEHVPVVLRFQRAGDVRAEFIVGDGPQAPASMPGMRM